MMTTFYRLAVALLLVAMFASPAFARMAAIQTAEPLTDQSEAGIQSAAKQAVEVAVRGAVAMGLPQVQLRRAVVVHDMVVIQIVASDDPADGQDRPGDRPDGTPGEGPRIQPPDNAPNNPEPENTESRLSL